MRDLDSNPATTGPAAPAAAAPAHPIAAPNPAAPVRAVMTTRPDGAAGPATADGTAGPGPYARFREDLACIRERDPAARSTWEVVTCYPGLHALWLYRLAHALWARQWHWAGRMVSTVARFVTGVEIHPGAVIGRRVFIDHGHGVVIGETAEVGDDSTIYQGVTLGGTSLARGTKRHPTLGRGVIVGAGAKVLGSFTVGDGARVGSNAVVVKEVPPGATAVGNPARILRRRAAAAGERSAQPAGFSAYGLSPDADDPLARTLQGLSEQLARQQQRIDDLAGLLRRHGIAADPAAGDRDA
jgi:serine O-acetyltransferase